MWVSTEHEATLLTVACSGDGTDSYGAQTASATQADDPGRLGALSVLFRERKPRIAAGARNLTRSSWQDARGSTGTRSEGSSGESATLR